MQNQFMKNITLTANLATGSQAVQNIHVDKNRKLLPLGKKGPN
jgi:hypothetical protein